MNEVRTLLLAAWVWTLKHWICVQISMYSQDPLPSPFHSFIHSSEQANWELIAHSLIPSSRTGEIKALQRATAKDLIYNGSFQEAVAPLLILAECFAIMPVIGIKSGSAAKMYFAWASVRTIYSIIVFVLMMILTGLTIGVTFRHNVQFDSIGE